MVKFLNKNINSRKDAIYILVLVAVIILLLNVLSQYAYFRWDLTAEKKYSISDPTKKMVKNLKETIYIKVYLDGEMPAGFKRLRESTRDVLSEMRSYGGKKIEFEFIDPLTHKNEEEKKKLLEEMIGKGLAPTNVQTGTANESKQTLLFPCALAYLGANEYPIQLLDNQIGFSKEEILNNSVISLEYKFANAIQKLTQYAPPQIGFLKGHGELNEVELADIQQSLKAMRYVVQTVDLTKLYAIPNKLDALVIAKPTVPYSEQEKYKIDQYIMRGGKVLWLIDATTADMDSMRQGGVQNVVDRNLNLDDQLFKYGVRINTDLIQDINMCNPIPLVVGNMGNAPQTELFPWYYFPLLGNDNNHEIVKNIDPVASKFPSTIDTIRSPGVKKTILLHSSDLSKAVLTPARVHFGILQQKPNPAYYTQPKLPVAVLMEGTFTSLYKNRLAPEFLAQGDSLQDLKFLENSKPSKMIVVSDGDMIKNEITKEGAAYPLGFYSITRQSFANKDFMLNSIQYLVDNSGLLTTRNKDVKLRILNSNRVQTEKLKWQLINILLPILLVLGFGFGFSYWRKKRYLGDA